MKNKPTKIIKAYKFRIYPNTAQKEYFAKAFGSARFIYNKMLYDKISHYDKTKQYLKNTPAQYKKEYPWLKDIDSLILMNAHQDLERSYKNFFRKSSKFGFPNYKSRKLTKKTFKTSMVNNNIKILIDGLKLPKLDPIKITMERDIPSDAKINNITVTQTSSNKYYASINFEVEKLINKIRPVKYIGLDFSMSNLFVDSDGNIADNPKAFRLFQTKLSIEQRKLSKMKRNSMNYNKQKLKVAKIHEKIANIRKDFLHKTSREITNSYDVVCVEDLNMKSMSKSLNFGKSVHDNGWGMFVIMLKYKLEELGKYLIKANKFFPSSKQCSRCENKKDILHLSERTYKCDTCGLIIDRDLNAALNLKNYAIKELSITI